MCVVLRVHFEIRVKRNQSPMVSVSVRMDNSFWFRFRLTHSTKKSKLTFDCRRLSSAVRRLAPTTLSPSSHSAHSINRIIGVNKSKIIWCLSFAKSTFRRRCSLCWWRAAECGVCEQACVSCFGDKNAFDRNAVTNNLNFQIHRGPFYVRRFGLNRFSLRQWFCSFRFLRVSFAFFVLRWH